MKKLKSLKIMISFILIYGLFVLISPSFETNAASSTRAEVVTKTYKDHHFLKYPQVFELNNAVAQKKINDILTTHIQESYKGYLHLKKSMEEYKKEADCKKMPFTCQYSYHTSYKIQYNQNGKVSILLYDYMYSGGAHGLTYITAYNFNLKTGKQYTLSSILTSKTKFLKVTKYAKGYMIKHPAIFFVDDYTLENFKVNNSTQFYFTDQGIYLIFQEYEVAPYAAGNPIIQVPRSIYK